METDVTESLNLAKLWVWLETNRKPALWGAVVVVGAGLILWFILWQHGEKQIAAGEALSDIVMAQMAGPNARPAPEAYLKVAANYPSSGAGAQALLLAGGTLFAEGKYDQARMQFQRFRLEHPDSPLYTVALLGAASCLDAQGKVTEAIAAYKDIKDHHALDIVAPQAKFALARMYEAQNQLEPARALFDELARDPNTSLGSEAGMRLEELLLAHPELVPAAPAQTNAPYFDIRKQ